TGFLPVDADTPRGMLLGHLQHKHVPLGNRDTDLSEPLVELVHRALEAQPADRFADAESMKAAVQRLLDGRVAPLGLDATPRSAPSGLQPTEDSDPSG